MRTLCLSGLRQHLRTNPDHLAFVLLFHRIASVLVSSSVNEYSVYEKGVSRASLENNSMYVRRTRALASARAYELARGAFFPPHS